MLMLLVLPVALLAACDKVPLLAPTGSVINLFPATTTVSLNSEVTIIATVIENGVAAGGSGSPTGGAATRTGNGTPVQNGTVVSFTTTIGRIEPVDARTTNGQVNVRLITAGTSGTATITAYSGGASTQLQLKVGTAAAATVNVTTSPQTVGASGGTVLVTANVIDDGGSPLAGVPVAFTTDKGTITPTTTNTDSAGNATASLTTTATAKVTATAGTKTGSATVTVNTRSLVSFAPSAASASVATPITYTVTAADTANILSVRVDFGDGVTRDLGAIGKTGTASHAYCSPGQYTATATSTDATGDRQSLTADVIIGALPATLSPPATVTVDTPATFTVGNLGTTTQVSRFNWNWDDGTPSFDTTAPQTTHTFTTRGLKTIRVDVFGVGCSKIASATVTVSVS